MAKTETRSEKDQEALEQLLAELQQIPPGSLNGEEWLALVKKLPKLGNLPEGWSSADDIRELRGPLPDDDPDYQRNILGRR